MIPLKKRSRSKENRHLAGCLPYHAILWLNDTQKDAPTLGQVVGAYKSIVAVLWLDYIKSNNMECSGRVWQRNFHERVVRIAELGKKRRYIRDNPAKLRKKVQLG
jgi:hypothetical protein